MSGEFFLRRSFGEKMGVGEREAQWRYADLDPIVDGEFRLTEGVWVERVSYGTQFEMRIPGILYFSNN